MRIPKSFISTLLTFVLLLTSATSALAQKRTPRKPVPKPAVAQPLSFDNLLSVDSYKIYVEIRNVGQLISSSSVNEVLEPVLKLAAPPKEFKTAVKWLTAHSDAVTTSRMMVATSRTAKNLPNVLIAVEFENAEEAAKVEPQLNEVLLKVLPPKKPEASPSPQAVVGVTATASPATQSPAQAVPNFHVSRSGALVFITSEPLVIKNLRPRNRKALSEDSNFRTAHDRFTSESVFAFINIKAMDQEEKELQEKAIAERESLDAAAQEAAKLRTQMPEEAVPEEEPSPTDPESSSDHFTLTEVVKSTPPDPFSLVLSQLAGSFFGGFMDAKWPEAIALAGNLDASAFDVKALLVTSQTEKLPSIPFFPSLVPGPTIVPESPSILPSNTELFVTMSLDLPQAYAVLNKPPVGIFTNKAALPAEPETPFSSIEKKAGIKFLDDVLPLLGNEIVFSMPLQMQSDSSTASSTPTPETPSTVIMTPAPTGGGSAVGVAMAVKVPSPIIGLSLKDKEGMRTLLPKLIDGLGFKGASGLAQIEKREDTEIVNYANAFAYAFIGNFLVVSPDVKNIKQVVDSYLKRETLSSDVNFKNFTRWQPRQLQGQVYISPSLMESYKTWINEPSTMMSDQTREILSRLSLIAEPVTYSLSNEGNGPLHQLRIPKNLLVMAVAGFSAETNQPPMVSNERSASGTLYYIAHLENTAKSEKGSYLPLEELIAQKKFPKEMLEGNSYKFTVNIIGEGFEATAVPAEYGKTGKMSFFINEAMTLRGGDHGGGPATIADRPIQ
jgi:hypothetical protein